MGYFGLLWVILGYSGLLWATLGYSDLPCTTKILETYLQKQVWGAQNCTRQSSRRFGLERTRLTELWATLGYSGLL